MIKNIWFQTHWLLGITAGIVLAVVGVTGGLLSFEHELLRALNPGVITVTPRGAALSPADLLARVREQQPDKSIQAVQLSSDPRDAARVGFANASGGRRLDMHYVDPYTGELLGTPRGEAFFRTVTQLHRFLLAGDTGKAITGASTIALVVLALSGLYLRWPRRAADWRAWLLLHPRRKGRSFLWDVHSVVGTWVFLLYLLAALTGLYWSYGWYRDALFALTGAPRPTQAPPRGERPTAARAEPKPVDMNVAWAAFQREVPGFRSASFRFPERAGQPLVVTYLDVDPAHSRAQNRLSLDAASGAVKQHERYADKPLGAKLMSSMLALHSGSYFGVVGTVLVMLASLAMPLFAVTGWMLYLDRRKKKQATQRMRVGANVSTVGAAANELLIGFASQSGVAERLAWQTADSLQAAGIPVAVQPLARLSRERIARADRALFVVSTFGDGEPPDGARGFARKEMREPAAFDGLRYGLLALGDSHYRTYCGFGRAFNDWLRRHGAQPLFEPIEVDKSDAAALHDWQKRLRDITGVSDLPLWPQADYERWRLVERRLLNAGSAGEPTFHVVLKPIDNETATWQSGDLAEIVPRHSRERIERFLKATGLDGRMTVKTEGSKRTLAEALARSHWPSLPIGAKRRFPLQQLVARLKTLSPRQFSIASLPADGAIELLVRQSRNSEGLGLGSGWLTEYAPIGAEIELRVQRNGTFHLREGDAPAVFIGNGTGIAGLRGHLKARAAAGQTGNWLIFGERNAAHDFYFQEEIRTWQSSGLLTRVDLAFSRDQTERVYVQQRMLEARDLLREWIADGATVYVCGSAEGMAPGVDAVLVDTIGREGVDRLIVEGRYRRDVY